MESSYTSISLLCFIQSQEMEMLFLNCNIRKSFKCNGIKICVSDHLCSIKWGKSPELVFLQYFYKGADEEGLFI